MVSFQRRATPLDCRGHNQAAQLEFARAQLVGSYFFDRYFQRTATTTAKRTSIRTISQGVRKLTTAQFRLKALFGVHLTKRDGERLVIKDEGVNRTVPALVTGRLVPVATGRAHARPHQTFDLIALLPKCLLVALV